MAIALVQSNAGSSATATTNPAFSGATTTGNLVVLAFAADDYNGTPNAGWTQSAEMGQDTGGFFHGSYLWWRISAGETSFAYTIGSAAVSAWALAEFSGADATPYDISEGQFVNTTGNSYTTPNITPTAGNRLLVASISASGSPDAPTVPGSWTNSFTGINGATVGGSGGTRDAVATAYLLVSANGSTAYSTGATWSALTPGQSRGGLIMAFKEAAAPWPPGGSADANEKLRIVQSNLTVR